MSAAEGELGLAGVPPVEVAGGVAEGVLPWRAGLLKSAAKGLPAAGGAPNMAKGFIGGCCCCCCSPCMLRFVPPSAVVSVTPGAGKAGFPPPPPKAPPIPGRPPPNMRCIWPICRRASGSVIMRRNSGLCIICRTSGPMLRRAGFCWIIISMS